MQRLCENYKTANQHHFFCQYSVVIWSLNFYYAQQKNPHSKKMTPQIQAKLQRKQINKVSRRNSYTFVCFCFTKHFLELSHILHELCVSYKHCWLIHL